MQSKIQMPDWQAVADHYDKKGKDDMNYLVAADKRIVHHHSGIFEPGSESLTQSYAEEELLLVLGTAEDRLTHLGAKALDLKPGRGFDCGCGRGGSSFILAKDYGHNMQGITISQTQLEYARTMAGELHLEQKTNFALMNIYQADFDHWQGTFDFVWACESTEYMPDQFLLFQKWNQLLKMGGKVLLFAITTRESQLPYIEKELKLVDDIYETKIGTMHNYLSAAVANNFEIDNFLDLAPQVIPYYRLRLQSAHKRGSEEALLKGLENGYFKYFLLLLHKRGDTEMNCQ